MGRLSSLPGHLPGSFHPQENLDPAEQPERLPPGDAEDGLEKPEIFFCTFSLPHRSQCTCSAPAALGTMFSNWVPHFSQ